MAPRRTDLKEFTKGEIYALTHYANFSCAKIGEVLHLSTNTVKMYLKRVRDGHSAFASTRKKCGAKLCTQRRI